MTKSNGSSLEDANSICKKGTRALAAADKSLGSADSQQEMRVFVHLARDKDARAWREARAAGRLVGINDETPYGYGRAERMGCRVEFSRSDAENALGAMLRMGLRVVLGFDLLHAWRQRDAIGRADIVWTHTESQYLAVAAVAHATRASARLLGQTVWLMDRWPSFGFLRRALYQRLIRDIDVLTFLSPRNFVRAQTLFPEKRLECVRFGIPAEAAMKPQRRAAQPIEVLALGNDRHRDWTCLVEAVAGCADIRLRILSNAVKPRLARAASNIQVGRARSQVELVAALQKATLVCVPLLPNPCTPAASP